MDKFPSGTCIGAALQMSKDFEELVRVKGIYLKSNGKRNTHWWCVDTEGNIVDPTADQFTGNGVYE